MLRFAVILLLSLAIPDTALSDEFSRANTQGVSVNKQATFKNWGVGAMSCARYVEAREMPDTPVGPFDVTFRQWLMGFTTAFNVKDSATTDLLGRTSVERAMNWIEIYCRKNQDKEFFTAVWEFTKLAYPRRVKPGTKIARN